MVTRILGCVSFLKEVEKGLKAVIAKMGELPFKSHYLFEYCKSLSVIF